MKNYQIIGGGLIGLSTAYGLLKQGAGSVRVIEAREEVGLETSYANAGMVHASLANPWNGPGVGGQILKSIFKPDTAMKLRVSSLPQLIGWGAKFMAHSRAKPHWLATGNNYALAKFSVGLNRQWRRELSIGDGKDGDGLLKIFRRTTDFSQAKIMADKLAGLGLETHYMDGRDACTKEPALAPIEEDIAGAIYYPTDFKADAYKFCQALANEIVKLGGEIITDTSVSGFLHTKSGIKGVQTPNGNYVADTTIVCAGAQSYGLLKRAGVKLALRPVKGYSLTVNTSDLLKGVKYPKIPIIDENLHAAITPFQGYLRIAGTAELAGFDPSLSPSRVQPLLDMLKRVYPNLADGLSLSNCQTWHGFRPVSADGLPYIGKTKITGLAVNTGHAHMGWTLCAGSGALLADILVGNDPHIEAHAFRIHR